MSEELNLDQFREHLKLGPDAGLSEIDAASMKAFHSVRNRINGLEARHGGVVSSTNPYTPKDTRRKKAKLVEEQQTILDIRKAIRPHLPKD